MSICYRLAFPKINASMLRSQIRLGFEYVPPAGNSSWIYDWDTHPMLMIRESSGVKMDPIIFPKNSTYRIYVEAQVYKRISTVRKPCLKKKDVPLDYYIQICEQICIERRMFEANCSSCFALSILSELNWTVEARPCSFAIKNATKQANSASCSSETVEELQRQCTKGPSKCLPECDEWTYHYSTTVLWDKPVDSVMIWLTQNPFDGILTFEEVPTYTFDTFVSNVGGQLGLWLGASVVSVIQTIQWFASFLCGTNKITNRSQELNSVNLQRKRHKYSKNGRRNSITLSEGTSNGMVLNLMPLSLTTTEIE